VVAVPVAASISNYSETLVGNIPVVMKLAVFLLLSYHVIEKNQNKYITVRMTDVCEI
jgi:hypothetical protein